MATSTPNWDNFINSAWGWPDDVAIGFLSGANNLVVGTNPPFTLQDFLALYPKFGGVPVIQNALITQGSARVSVPSTAGLAVGNPVSLAGFPDGTTIQAINDATHLTLSNVATIVETLVTYTVSAIPNVDGVSIDYDMSSNFPDFPLTCTFTILINPVPSDTDPLVGFKLDAPITNLMVNGVSKPADFLFFYLGIADGGFEVFVNPSDPEFEVNGPEMFDGNVLTPTMAAGTFTLTQAVALDTQTVSMTIWNSPPIPFLVVKSYLFVALAALVQARWQEMWVMAIGLYVAHFLTLYAKSDGNPASPVGQIASQGLSSGITVAKAVGDVSVSYQPVPGLELWAAWNLTTYGQQLATFAKVIGSGNMVLY